MNVLSLNKIELELARIRARSYKIGIVGLGYVGIPLMSAATEGGFTVLGFDISEEKVDQLNQSKSPLRHISDQTITKAVKSARFKATTDFSRVKDVDCLIVAVPTPLTANRTPDLSCLESAVRSVAAHMRKGQLLVIESTTYPGTTENLVQPIVEAHGLRSGRDVWIAYSPEREDPGNPVYCASNIPKVVGGCCNNALRLVSGLYGEFIRSTVPVSSTATAEAVKLMENIYRAVNIGLVNELKIALAKFNVDVWEVIKAASTKPFGFTPFFPGPGIGGHCIPVDPIYLSWAARKHVGSLRLIEAADEINSKMPEYVLQRLHEALDRYHGKGLYGSIVLVVGLAYKKNVDDCRESPSLRIIELLHSRGATVVYQDDHISEQSAREVWPIPSAPAAISLTPEALRAVDAAIITTDHDGVDYQSLIDNCPLIIDTRNVLRNLSNRGNVIYA